MEHTLQKVEKNSRRHLRGATSFQRERKPPTPSSGWGPWGRWGVGATGNHEGGYTIFWVIADIEVLADGGAGLGFSRSSWYCSSGVVFCLKASRGLRGEKKYIYSKIGRPKKIMGYGIP